MGNELMGSDLDLEMAMYKLLFHRSYRQAFLDGRYEELHLSPENIQHLKAIAPEELDATANKICRNLLLGDVSETSGGLMHAFSRSLQTLQESGVDAMELMYEFAESEPFDQYREVPFAGAGICAEEAFYHFLRLHPLFEEGSANFYLLTHEFLIALLSIVVVNQDPAFVIDTWQVRNNGTVRYALQRVPKKKAEFMSGRTLPGKEDALVVWLYAATQKSFVGGPISPFVAELLEFSTQEMLQTVQDDLMSKYNVTAEAFDTQVQKLRDMGLIAPS
jgi:hypothetical protein